MGPSVALLLLGRVGPVPQEAEGPGHLLPRPDPSVRVQTSAARAELLLAGDKPDEVSTNGLPDRPALPLRGETSIKLVAVLDLDGDGVMSPGDLVGIPDCEGFPPVGANSCSLPVDRPLPGPPE